MHNPQRLRVLIERAGPRAQPLATRQLRYWHAKTSPFPHADRNCPDLRSPTPVPVIYTLAEMGEEGWCCHTCALDPPNDELVDVLATFESFEALPAVVGQRAPDDLVGQVHRAYRLVVMARQLRRHRGADVLADYVEPILASYDRGLSDARRRWNQDTLRNTRDPLGRFSVDASLIIETDTETDLRDLDWAILERGTPILNEPRRAAVDLPLSMVEHRIGVDLYSLGPAETRTNPGTRSQPIWTASPKSKTIRRRPRQSQLHIRRFKNSRVIQGP